MTRNPANLLLNPHFWAIAVITALLGLLYYSSHLGWRATSEISGIFVLKQSAIVRMLMLVPVAYTAHIFGLRAGFVMVAVAVAIMVPRAIFLSAFPREALLESGTVAILALLLNLGFEFRRRDISRREQALLKLEATRRQLESYLKEIRQNERTMSALQEISSIINHSLRLDEILEESASKIQHILEADILSIFLFDPETDCLNLKVALGMSDRFAGAIRKMKAGEGFNGWVAQTGQPCAVTDASHDPRTAPALIEEGIRSLYIVPLKSKDKIIGTLGVARRTATPFDPATAELLTLMGTELGVAAEKAALFQQLQTYTDQISRAGEQERLRIARELHDDTIQSLVAVSRRLDTFTASLQMAPVMLRPLERLQREIDEALVRMRRFLQDLRPPTLEYLGLIPALRELVSQMAEQSGIPVQLIVSGDDRPFSNEEGLLIYRVAQEALRNSWKHSRATQAAVDIAFHAEETVVLLADNGRGFDVKGAKDGIETGKLGLMGMKERAHLLRGTLDIISEPGRGTVLTLRIPATCRLVPTGT